MSTLIHSARLVTGGVIVEDAWVRIDEGRVVAVGHGDGWRRTAPRSATPERGAETPPGGPGGDGDATASEVDTVLDATELAGPGALLTPGFIDLHGHGGGGAAYDDGPEAIRTARALHRSHGTTRAVVSLVTAPLDELERRVTMIANLTGTDPDILGSHLEGPFLDAAHKGAHDAALLRAPRAEDLERLLSAGAGTVRQVTLAPELPGGLEAVRRVAASGAVAAIGHTGADADLCREAFDAGATLLTHAFNAMPGLHHRFPGPIGAATGDERVTLEVIADGVHVHADVIRVLFAAAPGRVALVTDAMSAAGAADGTYEIGSLPVHVRGGVARLAGTDTIAGSTLTQDAALRVAVAAGVSLPTAVHALTGVPAGVIGRGDLGTLAAGSWGDAVVLTAALDVRGVWTAGARVA